MTDLIYLFALTILFTTNVVTLVFLKKTKQKVTAKQMPAENALLLDLLQGEAMVRITRVVPSDVFLRSPRGRD